MSRNALAGASASASALTRTGHGELVRAEIGAEVLLELGDAIVVRGRPGRLRTLVIVDDRLHVGHAATELRALADGLVETLLRELSDDRRETL